MLEHNESGIDFKIKVGAVTGDSIQKDHEVDKSLKVTLLEAS